MSVDYSVLCPRAQEKIQSMNKRLRPETVKTLSTYSEEDQVGWIVNPMMQSIITNYQNQILSRYATGSPCTVKPTTASVPRVQVVAPVTVPVKVTKDDSESDQDMPIDIFDME